MASRKVAVVTGSNKGIGYAIVKGLCEKFDGYVYLTSRDIERGQAAVENLKAFGYHPLFHQLDTTDQNSIDRFRDHLKAKHGGIDVLVNNAAIMFKDNSDEPLFVIAKETITTNYCATIRLSGALFPLLRQNGRVVHVSSAAGHLSNITSEEIRAKFNDKNITVDDLTKLVETFIEDAAEGNESKWSSGYGVGFVSYVVSKVAVCCLTQIQQNAFNEERPNRNISVNSVHPGFIETDMASDFIGRLPDPASIEEGARAPLFLALEANLKGKYVWKDCKVVDWNSPTLAEPY